MTGIPPVQSRSQPTPSSAASRADLVQALTSSDTQSDQAVSRTRRIVHSTVLNMEDERQSRRRKSGLFLFASVVCITLLAPALWSSVDSFLGGGHFGDAQTQAYLLAVMLFPGIVAAAIAMLVRQRNIGSNQYP